MTKAQAIALSGTEWWATRRSKEIAQLQMNEPLLCMPFPLFQVAVAMHLNRAISLVDQVDPQIKAAVNGTDPIPSFDPILKEHGLDEWLDE